MSFRHKYAQELLDQIVAMGMDPWEDLARQSVAGGRVGIQTPLVPGYDMTFGDLIAPRNEEAAHEQGLEVKKDAKRGQRLWGYLRKMSSDVSWAYEDGGKQQYSADTGPVARRDFSAQRDRDNRSGLEIAWDQVGESFYRDSQEPEPALLNQQDYNFSTTHDYKTAVYEPEGTESVTSRHVPVRDDSGTHDQPRRLSTLFAENALRDTMTDEVPGLNFRQDIQKAATIITMDHALGFGGNNRPSVVEEDKLDPLKRLPGAKPSVDDRGWSTTEDVWDQHESFRGRQNDHTIVDYAAQPGPAV